MNDTHPVEVLITVAFPEALIDGLRQISPRLRITVIPTRRSEDIPADVWERCEVLYTDIVLPDPARAPKLRWVQFHYAGIDFALESPLLQKPDLLVTNLSGASAPQMSEYILMMMLGLGHRIPEIFTNQARADWPRDRWERFSPLELHGSTVGIVGYGSVGRELARLLRPFGVTVLATKRDVMHPEDTGYNIDGLGDPQGDLFHRLYPIEALCSMVKLCDFVIVSLPLTPQTKDLIGEEHLRAMKQGSYLIVVGRGGVIDQDALVSALQDNKIAGAALDVFAGEPLPATSPFWRLPNVIVTPHVSGVSPRYVERAAVLFEENLTRYLNNDDILNRYDPDRMY